MQSGTPRPKQAYDDAKRDDTQCHGVDVYIAFAKTLEPYSDRKQLLEAERNCPDSSACSLHSRSHQTQDPDLPNLQMKSGSDAQGSRWQQQPTPQRNPKHGQAQRTAVCLCAEGPETSLPARLPPCPPAYLPAHMRVLWCPSARIQLRGVRQSKTLTEPCRWSTWGYMRHLPLLCFPSLPLALSPCHPSSLPHPSKTIPIHSFLIHISLSLSPSLPPQLCTT